MDLYLPLALKLFHVVGAIVWVGGATVMTIVALLLDRRGDDEATLTATYHFSLLGNRFFLPLSLFVIATGLTLAWLVGTGFAAWAVLSAVIVVGTSVLGGAVLGPTIDRTVHQWKTEGDPASAILTGRRVLRLVKLDLAGQFAIISMMVLKPGWTDPLLLVPAALLALGALLYATGAPARATPVPA
jgi:uncharacterized membrane protein